MRPPLVVCLNIANLPVAEVVLATIVSRFKIALADNADQVVWNFASVRYPTVGKDSNKPEYPIKLERINMARLVY